MMMMIAALTLLAGFPDDCALCVKSTTHLGTCIPIPMKDKTGNGRDTECGNSKPICVMDNGQEPLTGDSGDDSYCKVEDVTDTGCSNHEPFCILDNKKEPRTNCTGEGCACSSRDNTDFGCNASKPLCVSPGHSEVLDNTAGTQYVPVCVNNKHGGTQDTGCGSNKPICVLNNGKQHATNGHGCTNNQEQTLLHLHCQRSNASATVATQLLEAFPDAIYFRDRAPGAGFTPLHYAASNSNHPLIALLAPCNHVAAGAGTFSTWKMPLHILCQQNPNQEEDLESIQILLDAAPYTVTRGTDIENAAQLGYTYNGLLQGFLMADMMPKAAMDLKSNPMVKDVIKDEFYRTSGIQRQNLPLDRIDDKYGLDGSYEFPNDMGENVHIYILHTGVNPDHEELAGRIAPDRENANFGNEPGTPAWNDCDGHAINTAGANWKVEGGRDIGCRDRNADRPLSVGRGHSEVSDTIADTNCVPTCLNNMIGDGDDTGCGNNEPICMLDNAKECRTNCGGHDCALWIKSESGGGTDVGCVDDYLLCVASNGPVTIKQLSSYTEDKCTVFISSAQVDTISFWMEVILVILSVPESPLPKPGPPEPPPSCLV